MYEQVLAPEELELSLETLFADEQAFPCEQGN
jgi:hypothetical protein